MKPEKVRPMDTLFAASDAVETPLREEAEWIHAAILPSINLAYCQNSVPWIAELRVENPTGVRIGQAELTLRSEPGFAVAKTWHIDSLEAESSISIAEKDVRLDPAFLSKLTEAETASVTLELKYRSQGEERIVSVQKFIELQPRNHWVGLSQHPQMVAAFVQPNDPGVERILKLAAEGLRERGKNAALNGYLDGPEHAWELMAAIWVAVSALKIDYALPPASFEHRGQKVRGVSHVLDSGLGTCMDLSLLFASAAEQAGLHPLVVFTRGHAMAGIWLRPEESTAPVIDDVSALRKRLRLKEVVCFETTLVAHAAKCRFSRATEAAAGKLKEELDAEFELAVDIKACRHWAIKPLASVDAVGVASAEPSEPTGVTREMEDAWEDAPNIREQYAKIAVDPAKLSPRDRIDHWQRKLLDLSLRNGLLNFKKGKKSLVLRAPDAGKLEDRLAQKVPFRLRPDPELLSGSDPRDRKAHEAREGKDAQREHALLGLDKGEIYAEAGEGDVENALLELFRAARSAMEEGGANTLFLAMGFLSWSRKESPETKYKAPLILLPVTLERASVRSGFTLTLHDDDPRFNPTLVEMLRQDFEIYLGISEAELPKDDSGLDIDRIWGQVSHAVRDVKGWEVTTEVVLSTFSFGKYLMWKDLVDRGEQLRSNPVVKHLIDTPRDGYPSRHDFVCAGQLDRTIHPVNVLCPLPADSSQLAAVMTAARGKDFVLFGPPGTGKSQTIANLIAHCLGERKRVLFVAEKIAALEVVYRRLQNLGLGSFCLELHSSKAKKTEVLNQLAASWDARGNVDEGHWKEVAENLRQLRDGLNEYVEALHRVRPNGLSVFQAIGRASLPPNGAKLQLSWQDGTTHDKSALQRLREVSAALGLAATEDRECFAKSPFRGVHQDEWTPVWHGKFEQALGKAQRATDAALKSQTEFLRVSGLPEAAFGRGQRLALCRLAKLLQGGFGRNWGYVGEVDGVQIGRSLEEACAALAEYRSVAATIPAPWSEEVLVRARKLQGLLQRYRQIESELAQPWNAASIASAREALEILEKLGEARGKLSVEYSDAVDSAPVAQMLREWNKAEKAFWPLSSMGKSKVRKALEEFVATGEAPEVAEDLPLLVRIQRLRSELAMVELLEAGPKWRGEKTKPRDWKALIEMQGACNAAKAGRAWEWEGFEALSGGQFGGDVAAMAEQMRELRALAGQIQAEGAGLGVLESIWQGEKSDPEVLGAALRFQANMRLVLNGEASLEMHERVASGDCGATQQAALRILQRRAELLSKLQGWEALKESSRGLWNGLSTESGDVRNSIEFQRDLMQTVSSLYADVGLREHCLRRVGGLLQERRGVAGDFDPYEEVVSSMLKALASFQDALEEFCLEACASSELRQTLEGASLQALSERLKHMAEGLGLLRPWCSWFRNSRLAGEIGLKPLVDAMEQGLVNAEEAGKCFEFAYCDWWLKQIVTADPVLRTFESKNHERRIQRFAELDQQHAELSRLWIAARLRAEMPAKEAENISSEWGTLRHEMNKKKRHLPLRELMNRIPSVVTKLTPCFLMSPLSIAQYLDTSSSAFDVVIFDEASQIPVWEAIGAMARGKQVVVVGDPKQLPPTSFFDRAESEEYQSEIEEDLESVLDECIAANLPTSELNWHYRSRHESLITFSNGHYYGGKLVTFPSPATRDDAVSLQVVGGVYDRGGSRTNPIEAQAIVDDITGRLRSGEFPGGAASIGVVTFNSEQQRLIENLLDAERGKDPGLEPFFAAANPERVFVKNLESVQGDERDCMYFSITYGPDAAKYFSLNFGPMNKKGGHRRLNVAITRARHELKVFASFQPDRIDDSRSKAEGIRDLKHFLRFAQQGKVALLQETKGSVGGTESPFEEAVSRALQARGWRVDTQIGVSSFRVDLGIVHPDAPGRYLAGVECDGATYHRAATARDRDKLRQQVLEDLGWKIARVWSTDWWIDPRGTSEKLHGHLSAILAAERRAAATVS